MLRKKMYTWFLGWFLYKAGRSGLLRLPAFVLSSPRRLFWLRRTPLPVSDSECSDMLPPPPLCSSSQASRTRRAGFKIDLYIFIYAYIKKEEGEGWIGVVAGWWSLGIRARGGRGGCREVRGRRPWRGGSRGRANSVGGRVECQLIMSLLLTPYVEFFMLSFTSLLNTDKFCVNLQNTHRAFLPRQAHEQLPSVFPCRRSEPANPDC